jgi:histidyl-tRNA synthetase
MTASSSAEEFAPGLDLFVAFADRARRAEILPWLAELRGKGLRADTDYAGRSLKGQLTQAGRLGARATLVVESGGQMLRRPGAEDVAVDSLPGLEELLA